MHLALSSVIAALVILRSNDTLTHLRHEHFDVGISELLAPCGFGIFEVN